MKKVVCIIQAHTTSTRLPNKIFKDLGGKSMLYHMVDRVSKSQKINDLVIATTIENEDDVIQEFCIENNIKYFRGSNENVLNRYWNAAKKFKADIVVRITSDCPLIEPEIIDKVIDYFNKNNYDYVSFSSEMGLIRGLNVEVFSMFALEKTFKLATLPNEQEHVTLYMYQNSDIFSIGVPNNIDKKFIDKELRLCVDEIADYELMKLIYDKFYDGINIVDTSKVIEYLKENNSIRLINSNVKQK